MNQPPEEHYRTKYFGLLEEVEAKEKEWGELEVRVRRILAYLVIIAEGPGNDEIAEDLSRIKESVKEGLDFPALEARVESLKERVLREGRSWESRAFPPVYQILIHLVERLPLPSELAERGAATVELLERGVSPEDLPEAIDAVARLVFELRTRAEEERRELELFLQELTEKLKALDSGFSVAHEAAERGFASHRSLDAAVRAEVQGLETSASQLADVEALRRAVSATLDSIRGHLETKLRDDEVREAELRREVETLRANLAQLEREVGERREQARLAREASLKDALTGCYNRLAYEERASVEEARTRRYGSPLSLVVLDVDHFKRINDSFGHKAGDQVLRAIAQIAASQVRQADFFGRFGGEEFVALLPETRLDAAVVVAEKVRRAVESFRFHSRGTRIPISLSCGVAELRPGESLDVAFLRADKALYQAKSAGRNRTASAGE